MIRRKILVVNADDNIARSLEEGLRESVYHVDASPIFLESMKKMAEIDYDLVCVYVARDVDAYLVDDVSRLCRAETIAITRKDPRLMVNLTGEQLTLKDLLYRMGAKLVVYEKDLKGEEHFLPLCLDCMFNETQPEQNTPTTAPINYINILSNGFSYGMVFVFVQEGGGATARLCGY